MVNCRAFLFIATKFIKYLLIDKVWHSKSDIRYWYLNKLSNEKKKTKILTLYVHEKMVNETYNYLLPKNDNLITYVTIVNEVVPVR